MTQENGMNHNVDGFDDVPNMVPGEVEAAEQLEPGKGPVRNKGAKVKLLLAFVGLLFAGGWGYANQQDFKNALGIQPKATCSSQTAASEEATSDCCPKTMAAKQAEEGEGACEGTCPLSAGENVAAKDGTCCENGRKKAMIAALLKGVDEKPENAVDSSEENPLQKEDETSEEVKTETQPTPAK